MNPFLIPAVLLWLAATCAVISIVLGTLVTFGGWVSERRGSEDMCRLEKAYPDGITIENFCRIVGDDLEAYR